MLRAGHHHYDGDDGDDDQNDDDDDDNQYDDDDVMMMIDMSAEMGKVISTEIFRILLLRPNTLCAGQHDIISFF